MVEDFRKTPPRKIPDALLNKFTMDGKIKIRYLYSDESYPPSKPIIYTKDYIDSYLPLIRRRKEISYKETTTFLYKALRKYNIAGQGVAVVGSQSPAFESICLYYGGKPTTIEYNKIISTDPRLKVMTVEEYDNNPVQFDAALSISSFEHDGLGRYGDALNPEADLEVMQKMKTMLKPKGLLFLAIPVGVDTLVWNVHRVYGRIRLPILLDNWRILDVFDPWALTLYSNWGCGYGMQPVFVLENSSLEGKSIESIYKKGIFFRHIKKSLFIFKLGIRLLRFLKRKIIR